MLGLKLIHVKKGDHMSLYKIYHSRVLAMELRLFGINPTIGPFHTRWDDHGKMFSMLALSVRKPLLYTTGVSLVVP